jgi:hypothetical protein
MHWNGNKHTNDGLIVSEVYIHITASCYLYLACCNYHVAYWKRTLSSILTKYDINYASSELFFTIM